MDQGYTMGWALAIPEGNTGYSHPVYPGYTPPPTHRTRCTSQHPADALLNANAFLSKLQLVEHAFTVHVSDTVSDTVLGPVLGTSSEPDLLGN